MVFKQGSPEGPGSSTDEAHSTLKLRHHRRAYEPHDDCEATHAGDERVGEATL